MLVRSSRSCALLQHARIRADMTVVLPSVRLASSSTAPPPLLPPLSSKERVARNQAKRVQVSRDFRTCVHCSRARARAAAVDSRERRARRRAKCWQTARADPSLGLRPQRHDHNPYG